jgi:hypothetical protein
MVDLHSGSLYRHGSASWFRFSSKRVSTRANSCAKRRFIPSEPHENPHASSGFSAQQRWIRPPWIRAHTPDRRTGPRSYLIPPESTASHSGERPSSGYSAHAPRRTSEARACDTSRPRQDGVPCAQGNGGFGSCRWGWSVDSLPRLITLRLRPKGTQPAVSFP